MSLRQKSKDLIYDMYCPLSRTLHQASPQISHVMCIHTLIAG
jgi:hypothetical protein